MDREIWIACCADRLHQEWCTADTDLLDEVAASLWRNERLRQMPPALAAVTWLARENELPF